MSEENDGSLLRAQNAVALCSIVSLALLWKVYDDQQQQIAQLQQMQDNVAKIERGLKQVESKRLQESAKSRSLQTKNALFAVVPCKRNPGGLCPVTSDPSLRLDMVDRIMKESADKDFQGVNLQGLNLSKINWNGANLTYAQLDYSDFRGADLSNVDFSHASLIGADFTGAKLNNTTLIGADLAGASLENAQLNNTKLQTANLRGVHACGAIFKGVKLSAAWLQGAALWGADLSASNATGYFRGAYGGKDTKWKGNAPEGLLSMSYAEMQPKDSMFVSTMVPFGPEAAPFLGAKVTDGTICPTYLGNQK